MLADPAFGALKAFLIAETGLAYFADRDQDLADRVAARFNEGAATTCRDYLDRLRTTAGRGELDVIVAACTVGETYFFRHAEQFAGLRDIALPSLIEANRAQRRLRIWCAGCATGPEPYSLALLLLDAFPGIVAEWDVRILATDINKVFLEAAEEGVFREWAFRGTDADFRHRHFQPIGDTWAIREEARRMVTFHHHNLMTASFVPMVHEAGGAFDLISCRNVMIYFDQATSRALVRRFHAALGATGWLMSGHADVGEGLYDDFAMKCIPGATLFQVRNGSREGNLASAERLSGVVALPRVDPAFPPAPSDRTSPGRPRRETRPATRKAAIRPAPRASPAPPTTQPPTAKASDPLAQARHLADVGRLDEAVAVCEEALRADPVRSEAHLLKALVHEQAGSLDEAEEALRKAIYLDRDLALGHYHLGAIAVRHGRGGVARRHLRNALGALSTRDDRAEIPFGKGMTAADLRELIGIQLEIQGNTGP